MQLKVNLCNATCSIKVKYDKWSDAVISDFDCFEK